MQSPSLHAFALAKIQPPRPRAGWVERPTLEQSLGRALAEQRLTLLVAPAGYGKTAALTRQLRQLPAQCALAWVSADEDDHLQRFLACLSSALEPHDVPWRVAPEALATLALAERGVRDVAGELVNALAGADVERGLVVIDDAHRIADPRVFELLQLTLERLPEQWGLVIAGRVEPPLSLARLRAAGELAEFRQHDLRFNEAEVTALLSSNAVAPARAGELPQQARELLARTDGWAAGLRLSLSADAGAASQSRPASRTQRHLFDYLAAEVLDDMPRDLRELLLRCSVLPELTAARCAHVSGITHAAQLLDEIERRGLFVSLLDADEMTLRLHDLFRDFLEDRLQREYPGDVPTLLRRAADHESDLQRKVGYLTRAGAWAEATRTLAQRAQEQLSIGAGPALEQMLKLFPDEEFDRRPDLHLVRGLAAWPRFDWDTLRCSMERAVEGYTRDGRQRDAVLTATNACSGLHHAGRLDDATRELARLRAQPLDDAVKAFVLYTSAWDAFAGARGDDAAPAYAAMLDALERMPVAALWHQFPIHWVFVGLPGMRPLLARFADGASRIAGDAPSQLHAGVMQIRCWLALADGRIDEAWQWLARADDDCRWLGMPRLVVTGTRMAHALMHALRGEGDAAHTAARELVDDIEQHSPLAHRRVHANEVLFIHSRTSWMLQDEPAVRSLDAALERATNACEWKAAPLNRQLSRAFVALFDGRLDDAEQLLAPLAADINRCLFYPADQARVMLADVQQRLGRIDDAVATLRPWLDAVHAGGEIGAALLAGPDVIHRLARLDWGRGLTGADTAVLRRLAAWSLPARDAVPAAGAAAAPAPAPRGLANLTEREREVLGRIAAGDSNKLIARAFDLSPHTVKRHVANILDKLGLQSRGQAAAWYREQR